MPTIPTVEQITALAPDDSAIKSGKELAIARKWVTLGYNDRAAWGECQGSGKLPYQTRIDLIDTAFKCSCPSRKFPCKHGLGLFLLLSCDQSAFKQTDEPSWVKEWVDSRQERSDKKAKKKEEAAQKPVDTAAQAKRVAERQSKVSAGITDLQRWLQDLIRQGIAGLQSQPYTYWESMASRMVDSQAPGLARMIRDCAGITGDGWQERLLAKLSLIHLLADAYNRLDALPEDTQADVRTFIGFVHSQDDLLAKGEGVSDSWQVLGQKVEQEDKLRAQRTWLRGITTGRNAVVLSYAFGNAPLDMSLVPGIVLDAELVFFPSAFPLRALVRSKSDSGSPLKEFAHTLNTAEAAFDEYAAALSRLPWLETYPMLLENLRPVSDGDAWWFVDRDNKAIPFVVAREGAWQILSLSGGNPISVFGEWNGSRLHPLSVCTSHQYIRVQSGVG